MRALDQPNKSLLDTLLELQHLDRVPRSGYLLRGVANPESVAEHTYHLAFLVMVLGQQEPEVNVARAVELALLHDCAEVRTGDLPRPVTKYLEAGAKKSMERSVLEDLLAPLDEVIRARATEYMDGESLEARFVSACDRLQLLLKVHHYQRHGQSGLDEFWKAIRPTGTFTSVDRVLEELHVRRGGP